MPSRSSFAPIKKGYATILPCSLRCACKFSRVAAATLWLTCPTFAADYPEKLDGVVVTGQRLEAPARLEDVDTAITSGFFSIIERDSFEGGATTLSEIIESETGVQIRDAGGLGSYSSASLRGSSGAQVKVFVDGVPLNDAASGGVNLSEIPLADVERVEIYRGTTPLPFSQASLGGVINIRTIRANSQSKGQVTLGVSSFDTRKANAFLSNRTGVLDYVAAAELLRSVNDFPFRNDNGTPLNTSDDVIEPRHNNAVEQNSVLIRLGRSGPSDMRWDITGQWFQKRQGLPSWINDSATKSHFDTDRFILSLRLTKHRLFGSGPDISFHGFTRQTNEIYDDRQGHIGLGRQHAKYTTRSHGIDLYAKHDWDIHSFGISANVGRETYTVKDFLDKSNPNDNRRDTTSLGIQDTLFLLDDTLLLTPTIRWQSLDDHQDAATSTSGSRLTGKASVRSDITAQIGAKTVISERFSLKTNIGHYVRQPTFFELFGDRGFFMGNEELVAERGINFDAGFEWHSGPLDTKFIHQVQWNAAYFQKEADDIIAYVYDARGVGQPDNIARATIYGIENTLSVALPNGFHLSFNGTWQETRNHSDIGAFDGKRLPGRYTLASSTKLAFHRGPVRAFVEQIIETGTYYDTANLLPSADKNQIDLGATWIFRRLSIEGKATNITNDRHEDYHRYPKPGRSFFAGVKYHL